MRGRPWSGPHRRILDPDRVLERVRVKARPPFDEVQVLVGTLEVGLWREIRHVDDQRLALPPAARIPPPLADVRRKMRSVGDRDEAIPPLSLPRVVENRELSAGLHDATETAEIRQGGAQTTLP